MVLVEERLAQVVQRLHVVLERHLFVGYCIVNYSLRRSHVDDLLTRVKFNRRSLGLVVLRLRCQGCAHGLACVVLLLLLREQARLKYLLVLLLEAVVIVPVNS